MMTIMLILLLVILASFYQLPHPLDGGEVNDDHVNVDNDDKCISNTGSTMVTMSLNS